MRRLFITLSVALLALAPLAACERSVETRQRSGDEVSREGLPGIGDTIVRDFDAVTLVSVEETSPPAGLVGTVPVHWVGVVYDVENRRDSPFGIPFGSPGAVVEGVGDTGSYGATTSIGWSPDAVIPGEQRYQDTQLKPGASIRIAVQIPCENEYAASGTKKVTCLPFGSPGFDFEASIGPGQDR